MSVNYGMKVSQPGEDVKTAGASKLMFSSSLLTNPVYEVVDFTMSSDPYTYSHGLGFAPKAWVFLDTGTYLRRVPYNPDLFDTIDYEINSTNIIINADSGLLSADLIIVIFTREVTD